MQNILGKWYWELPVAIALPLLSQVFGINGQFLKYLNKLNEQPLSSSLEIIILILFWTTILSLPYLIILKFKTRLTPRFGIYWDNKKNQYCPSCRKQLGQYFKPEDPIYPYYYCISCKENVYLRDERGQTMSLEYASALLNVKNITKEDIKNVTKKQKDK